MTCASASVKTVRLAIKAIRALVREQPALCSAPPRAIYATGADLVSNGSAPVEIGGDS